MQRKTAELAEKVEIKEKKKKQGKLEDIWLLGGHKQRRVEETGRKVRTSKGQPVKDRLGF